MIEELILPLLKGWRWLVTHEVNFEIDKEKIIVNIDKPGIIWAGGMVTNNPDTIARFEMERPEVAKEAIVFETSPRIQWDIMKQTIPNPHFPYTTSSPADEDYYNIAFTPVTRYPVRRCKVILKPPSPGVKVKIYHFLFVYMEIYDRETYLESIAEVYRKIYGIDEILARLDKLINGVENLTEEIKKLPRPSVTKQIIFDPI